MRIETLDILRCPFCGGHLELVTSMFHQTTDTEIHSGILGCQCCIFPVVDGIPVLHLRADAVAARAHIEAGTPQHALRAMVGLDEAQAERFEAAAGRTTSTYKDIVDALGPGLEGGYFLYRFTDPTFIVANAVVRAVAGTVLGGTRRAIDICGGSGHLTRSLMDLSSPAPVLADLFFPKVWLARRFTAPGCEPVCCDGNSPMPFAHGAFGYAMCSDAFMYIWTKRLFVGEMTRLVAGADSGTVVITHTHNQLTWSPSHGQPLSPEGYANLFETLPVRQYAETGLFADVMRDGSVDLGRRDAAAALDADPALTLIASRHADLFRRHQFTPPPVTGEFRINPLYAMTEQDDSLRLTLTFPDGAYEEEYGACREYLPDTATLRRDDLASAATATPTAVAAELLRRRVIVELPKGYY